MKNNLRVKRLLSLILSVVLLWNAFPSSAYAFFMKGAATESNKEMLLSDEGNDVSFPQKAEAEVLRPDEITGTYNASNDISYLQISTAKYGNTIVASSIGDPVTVNVLEHTKWKLKAEFIEIKDGKLSKKDVTNKCKWTVPNAGITPISFTESSHTVNVFSQILGYNTGSVSASYNSKTVSISFRIVHLSVPQDKEALCCMSLNYLVTDQWAAINEYKNSKISSFVFNLRNGSQNSLPLIKRDGYQNSATFSHLIAETAGNYSVRKCIDVGPHIRAAVFEQASSAYLVFFCDSLTNIDVDLAKSVYDDVVDELEKNVVVVGEGAGGKIASFLSYKTGCRCVTFNAPTGIWTAFRNKQEEFYTHYSMANKVNYILLDSEYNTDEYHTDPYYIVSRQTTNGYDGGLALLSSMVSYNQQKEQAMLVKSAINRSPYAKPAVDVRNFYLGYDDPESIEVQIINTQVVFGGGGNDRITLRHDTGAGVEKYMSWLGEYFDHIADFLPSYIGLAKGVAKLTIDNGINAEPAQVLMDGLSAELSALGILSVMFAPEVGVAVAGVSGVIAVVSLCNYMTSKLAETVAFSFFDGTYGAIVAGGQGNDEITGTDKDEHYFYSLGDGLDIIDDGKGSIDTLTFLNCEDVEVTWEMDETESGLVHFSVDHKPAVDFQIRNSGLVYIVGSKSVLITKTLYENMETPKAVQEVHIAQCPVDMLVFDQDGSLVQRLEDGVESEKLTEYGAFIVSLKDNEYVKTAVLFDHSYRVKMVGKAPGTMKYSVLAASGEGELPKFVALDNIPVRENAVYFAPVSSSDLDDMVVYADWDGDGNIDEVIRQNTAVRLSESAIELHYGEQAQLSADINTNSSIDNCCWISSDNEVAVVDENGLVTAVGFGEARIFAMSVDGTYGYDVCTVTVPEEIISVDNLTISGIREFYPYTGSEIIIELEITYHDIFLVKDEDYTVSYSNLTEPGQWTATITGLGKFNGQRIISYQIVADEEPNTVEAKVREICKECREEGISGEYEAALWLHDWLIYHANYDYSYTWYDSEGVLLHGTGVCQSYTNAFHWLLNEMDIENKIVVSGEMNHAWNLVRIDGEWCHIDCTWDDPGVGGMENHTYFGMNDGLLARDHIWERGSYISSTSLQNYYLIRRGEPVFANMEELDALLAPQFTSREESITVQYIGTDPDITALSAFEDWYSRNNWKYGIRGFSTTYGKYICTIHDIVYVEPWTEPVNKLRTSVDAPAFSMNSPNGNFSSDRYRGNGLVLIFGRDGCLNTRGLLQRLQAELDDLHRNGIEVLISIEAAESYGDIKPVKDEFPDFWYCYEQQGLLSAYLEAVDYYNTYDTGWIEYPCVFIINGEGKITYYSTGYVPSLDELVSEAYAASNLNPLPVPAKNQYSAAETGNANLKDIGDGKVKRALQTACKNSEGVFFLTDSEVYYYDALMMEKWEENHELFESLGISFIACFEELTEEERQTYPHVTFVEYDEKDPFFWDLLGAVNWDPTKPAYYQCCYFLEHDGHITDYRNGATLSIWDKIAVMVNRISYDMLLPAQLQEIGEEAFYGGKFTSVDMSSSDVVSIGKKAFANCRNLRFIRLPDSLEEIDPSAFSQSGNVFFICGGSSAGADFAEENGIPFICP